jgi:uncharacterized membrane protein YedE/YeeE
MDTLRWFRSVLLMTALIAVPASHAVDTGQIADNQEALKWWIESAEQGNAELQYGLGKIYELGMVQFGAAKDEQTAVQWFRRAADQGHPRAQFALARAYEDGRGVAADPAAAREWYGKAAEQGYAPARERLAQLKGAKPATAVRAATVTTFDAEQTDGRFWTWWQGALMLGFIAIAFWYAVGAPLGVSSSWDRVVHWREESRNEEIERHLHADKAALEQKLLAETLAQFGEQAAAMLREQGADKETNKAPVTTTSHVPWPAHLTFLATLALGGMLAAAASGDFQVRLDMGAEFARLFGGGWHAWVLLAAGGFLVGFGTRMAGGCTSGHGLSGCARLQPGSLAATTAFFGTAVTVSLLMEMMIR